MKIQIRKRDVKVTKILRAHVERRLGFALGRFGERIEAVIVRFSRANGPPAGAGKRCRIEVALRPRSVRVEDADADLFSAVDHAADLVSRSFARAFDRERDWVESPDRLRT